MNDSDLNPASRKSASLPSRSVAFRRCNGRKFAKTTESIGLFIDGAGVGHLLKANKNKNRLMAELAKGGSPW